jgi:hypothetical protein
MEKRLFSLPFFLKTYYHLENKRRDRVHGVMKEGKVETNEDADRVSAQSTITRSFSLIAFN